MPSLPADDRTDDLAADGAPSPGGPLLDRAIRQVLLVGHTHHDVGYTNSPRLVDDLHAETVRRVLDLCDTNDGDGPDAFRWTFEVVRPVLRFLETAGPADVDRLRRRVAEGRVTVTGGYLNMTQLPGDAELDAAYDALDRLRAAGVPVRTEQHGDVNGIAWGAVDAMRRAGIDRLVMALNPDHGRPPYPQPTGFWWEGPAGGRVFTWLSTHYGVGEEWGIVDGDVEAAEAHVADFVAALGERDDYPYDTAVVHAANDNRWPTALFLEVVRHWNARHPDVPMRTATVDEALDVLRPQAEAADVPVARGEWSDWWAHGHGSTAREVAVYREARSFARAAQTTLGLTRLRGDGSPALADVIGYRRGPVRLRSDAEVARDLDRVDAELLLFAEHTWGSWETYSKPYSSFSHSHWNAKAGFAYGAFDLARDLAVEGLFRVVVSDDPAGARPAGSAERATRVVVVNPTGRARTEPVEVEVHGRARARTVATVPAFGVATVPLPPPPGGSRAAREVACGAYRAVVDPARGGVVSLVHRPTGRELVDDVAGHGLGAVVTETVVPGSEHPMVVRDPKDFHPDFPGPDFDRRHATGDEEPLVTEAGTWARIAWRTTPPGLPTTTTTLTLYRDLDVVDLEVALVKPEVFGPESIHVAFPFRVADPELLLETAGAVYAAETEQLPDTSKDWYSIQHAVGVHRPGEDGGVLWGAVDAPLVQLGGLHTGEWARKLRAPTGYVSSWLMNNLHFTNFQARQEGTRAYRYRFAAVDGPVTRERVRVFGRDLAEPLQARAYDGPVTVDGATGLRVTPADRVLAEVRPLADGSVRVRLRNVAADPVEAEVAWDGPGRVVGAGPVLLGPHGVGDVRLRREG
ncbi:hypothetical protein [Cellulomonas pakistanensis]|uniref:Glycoside hydrolase family 38 N-terminal domain-containing protein n=1 Tax=Cellulomonas pakistanensis TaxID=992287 RepID=A0A919PA84_9CELL|nr:hypothetical protein [Cellulomonas pakistanensis]GIG35881.1 hypothetical protein Cpa01nite_12620 [Cellulomonas pakistanensis]